MARTLSLTRWLGLILIAAALFLGGCGDGAGKVSGDWVNAANAQDKIVFKSGSKATVTAIAGQGIDVWNYGPVGAGAGGQLGAAQNALTTFETVEVTWKWLDKSKTQIILQAEGRGSRQVRYDQGVLKALGNRTYFKSQK